MAIPHFASKVPVEDAVRAICAAAASETIAESCKYVVGSGEGYSLRQIINEVARQVENLNGSPVEVLIDTEAALAPIEWRKCVVDYSRLHAATAWNPKVKLQTGIDTTLRAFIGGQSQ